MQRGTLEEEDEHGAGKKLLVENEAGRWKGNAIYIMCLCIFSHCLHRHHLHVCKTSIQKIQPTAIKMRWKTKPSYKRVKLKKKKVKEKKGAWLQITAAGIGVTCLTHLISILSRFSLSLLLLFISLNMIIYIICMATARYNIICASAMASWKFISTFLVVWQILVEQIAFTLDRREQKKHILQ